MVISEDLVKREVMTQSKADELKIALHLGVLPLMMITGALLMSRRVSVSKFDEVRGKFKRHRNNMKAFTKEKQAKMEMDHNALLEMTKEEHKIWEMNQLDDSRTSTGTIDKGKRMEKMRRQSMKKLRKQSTKNVMLTSSLNLTDGNVFAEKFVPMQSSGEMLASKVTVLTK